MEFAVILKLSLAILILMLKPGPVMVTCMTLSLDGRWRSVLAFWSGYLVTRTITYYLLLSSLAIIPQGFGMVFIFVKAAAAMLFITLGLKGLQASMSEIQLASEQLKDEISGKNYFQKFTLGGFLHVSNPYDYVFILAVIPALVGTTEFSLMDITIINLIVIFFDTVVNAAYILPILYMRKFFDKRILKYLRIASSAILILIGFYIFATMFIRDGLVASNLISG